MTLYRHDQLTKVAQIILHPKFNMSLSAWGGADIALLKLETAVTLSDLVHPVSLAPDSLMLLPGMKCWVTGWGTLGKIRGGGRGRTGQHSGRVHGDGRCVPRPQVGSRSPHQEASLALV